MSAFAGTVPRGEWSLGPLGRVELVEGGRAVVVLGWCLYVSLGSSAIAKVPGLKWLSLGSARCLVVLGVPVLHMRSFNGYPGRWWGPKPSASSFLDFAGGYARP